jgi:hypothetical protein
MINHSLTAGLAGQVRSGKRLLPSCVYSTANALPEGPQSGEVMGMVGSGKEVNGAVLVRSFASRPFWEERRVPRQPSMNGGRPISMFDNLILFQIFGEMRIEAALGDE